MMLDTANLIEAPLIAPTPPPLRPLEEITPRPPYKRYETHEIDRVRLLAPHYMGAEIARDLGITVAKLYHISKRHRIRLRRFIETPRKGRRVSSVRFANRAAKFRYAGIFDREAEHRGMRVGTLARVLLEAIADANLFEAVLDR